MLEQPVIRRIPLVLLWDEGVALGEEGDASPYERAEACSIGIVRYLPSKLACETQHCLHSLAGSSVIEIHLFEQVRSEVQECRG